MAKVRDGIVREIEKLDAQIRETKARAQLADQSLKERRQLLSIASERLTLELEDLLINLEKAGYLSLTDRS